MSRVMNRSGGAASAASAIVAHSGHECAEARRVQDSPGAGSLWSEPVRAKLPRLVRNADRDEGNRIVDAGRVLIVGGGIGGLSLAAALHRQGCVPELIERAPAWQAIGAGIVLHANGVRALRQLGMGAAVYRIGAALPRWGFFDQQAQPLCRTDLEKLWGNVGPCLGTARVRLQQAMVEAAAAVPVRLGVAITSLDQDGPRVTAGFSDGTSGAYDLVVGADGIYSTVRKLLRISGGPEYAGVMSWRSVISSRPAGVDEMMVLLGDGCFVGVVPLGGGQTYSFAAIDSDPVEDPMPGRLARFRRRFAAFGGPVPEYLAALESDEQLHFGPIEWVDLDSWHSGRVVLVGDAAHAAPPHMGEGGSLAIEDALVLAEVLRDGDSVEQALDAYATRRRPRVGWVQQQSRAAARAWILPPDIRNAALRDRGDQMLQDRYRPLIEVP
jgi:2-polyprenyl-6-methoxyphenol hydroxylase-like FAD-dependent oxidoreductase